MSTGAAGQTADSGDVPKAETKRRYPRTAFLRTADGVSIHAAYEPGTAVYDPPGAESDHPVIVIAHGFTGDLGRPHVRRIARSFSHFAAVITFSFRGHGASGGHSTVGDKEVLDLAAAVAWARELGHRRIATAGFSLGGSVVVRHAALPDAGVDAVATVSGPARWYYRGTAAMRRLHWVVMRPAGRLVGRLALRTRIHHRDWDPVPPSPVESAPLIAPVPLLVVHGDSDPYFPLDHPRSLVEASGGHAEFWLEEGMGHAENAVDEALARRLGAWLADAARRGR
ncbi:alpha/beta fold hydrolase [Streptomyces sp. NPDC002734]|uniref:alpha/beta hydrolase n=1 Tax=Streptomyces sp. NPDC002734 TaxID=3154426 RepID=UPI003319B2DA